MAVGIGQIVTTENSHIQWYDRSGNLQSDQPLNTFFSNPSGTPIADSRVVYDSFNNRFVVESGQGNDRVIRLAVSRDSDPNHGWWFGSINTGLTVNGKSTYGDFPGLATDGKAIYLTTRQNDFGPDGQINTADDTLQETHLWIIKDGVGTGGIYDGGALVASDFGATAITGGNTNNFGQPTQILSPTGGALGTFLVNASISGRVLITRIDNPTTSPSFQFQTIIGAPSGSFPTLASQPGTFEGIEAHTVGNAVWRNGSLYAVGVVGPTSGPNAGLPTAHWYKIDTSNLAALALTDQGDVGGSLLGGAGIATYQPTISADVNGNFLVNFSASGPTLFAGAYYAVHTNADPAGTVETPQTLHVGQDTYVLANSDGDIRWGDYSGIAADPVNPNTVWVFNQYAALRSPGQDGNWATQVAAVPLLPGPSPLAGGRWVFSPPAGFSGLILGINNGVAPVFPAPVAGAFNIEVFTSPALSGQPGIPNPDSGFQSSIADPGATLDAGFLTGTDLRLTTGNLLLVDSVTGAAGQSTSKVTLGSGNQTVVGAKSDTLVGGSGSQILSALAGNETVVGGTGNASIWGGAGDSIVGGTGASQQIVLTGSFATVVAGMAGNATISAAAVDTILSLGGSTQNVIIAGGVNGLVDLTGNSGLDAVIGASGDTIVAGGGTTNIEGINGGMRIVVGAAGTTNVSGSGVPGVGNNTIVGGSGNLNFNPSAQIGQGDLFNLSGSTGNTTINAFSFGGARIASPDTIVAGNGADSVFGGAGDRIGTGNSPSVGGVHLWDHSDPLAGAALAFGSNDTVAATVYDTIAGTATRHPEIAGSSTAVVTVTNFSTTSDSLFYQNENAGTTGAIIATSQATTIAGAASTVITLPDGTVMTLVGITQAQLTPALFKP